MKCSLGECFKQDTNPCCRRDVVPLLSDTRRGQEELDNGHHEHSPCSGEGLTWKSRERCTWSSCLQDMGNARTERRLFPVLRAECCGGNMSRNIQHPVQAALSSSPSCQQQWNPENSPRDLLVGAHGLCPYGTCVTVVRWWKGMQSSSLLGNTPSKTPSQRKIGPKCHSIGFSKLWEALVQVTLSAALPLDTTAARRTSQIPWHWGFPILPRTQESILFSSQLPVTRTVHWGESVVFPIPEGSAGWLSSPKEHSKTFGLCCHLHSSLSPSGKYNRTAWLFAHEAMSRVELYDHRVKIFSRSFDASPWAIFGGHSFTLLPGKPLQSPVPGLCLAPVSDDGWVGSSLWSPSKDLNTASILHHCQTGNHWTENLYYWDGLNAGETGLTTEIFYKRTKCAQTWPRMLWLPVVWAGLIVHVIWPRHFTGKSCVRAANSSSACFVRMWMPLNHVLYRSLTSA